MGTHQPQPSMFRADTFTLICEKGLPSRKRENISHHGILENHRLKKVPAGMGYVIVPGSFLYKTLSVSWVLWVQSSRAGSFVVQPF